MANRKVRLMRLRSKLSEFYFKDNIQKPTAEELREAQEHAAHELAIQEDGHQHVAGDYTGDYELDGQAADGHQYDGRHTTDDEQLRQAHTEGEELRKH